MEFELYKLYSMESISKLKANGKINNFLFESYGSWILLGSLFYKQANDGLESYE